MLLEELSFVWYILRGWILLRYTLNLSKPEIGVCLTPGWALYYNIAELALVGVWRHKFRYPQIKTYVVTVALDTHRWTWPRSQQILAFYWMLWEINFQTTFHEIVLRIFNKMERLVTARQFMGAVRGLTRDHNSCLFSFLLLWTVWFVLFFLATYFNKNGDNVLIKIIFIPYCTLPRGYEQPPNSNHASRFLIEKLCLTIVKRACDINNFDQQNYRTLVYSWQMYSKCWDNPLSCLWNTSRIPGNSLIITNLLICITPFFKNLSCSSFGRSLNFDSFFLRRQGNFWHGWLHSGPSCSKGR